MLVISMALTICQQHKLLLRLRTFKQNIKISEQRLLRSKHLFFINLSNSVSIDYEKCVTLIKELKCNNIDQWQSVIEELKL